MQRETEQEKDGMDARQDFGKVISGGKVGRGGKEGGKGKKVAKVDEAAQLRAQHDQEAQILSI